MAPTGGAVIEGHDTGDCAWSPHKGCMCGIYGRFVGVEIGWQTDGLTVLFTEYDRGTIWVVVYSGEPLKEADQDHLDSLADVETDAVDTWSHRGPTVSRMHFYGVLHP